MPFFCGYEAGVGLWWIFPLLGFLFMAVMMFDCIRGFGRSTGFGFGHMARRWRGVDEVAELRRELRELGEDVRRLAHPPA
jgi:hypothetical protein